MALRPAWFRKEARRAGQAAVFPYAGNNPTGSTDPDGRMAKFVARLAKATKRGIQATGRLLRKRQAVEAAARGANVVVEGTKNAKAVASEAGKLRGGDGAVTKAESHALRGADGQLTGERGADHFHALDRNGERIEGMGHIFTAKDIAKLGVAFVAAALDSNEDGEVDHEDMAELAYDILTPVPGVPTIAEQREALFPSVEASPSDRL